MVALVYVVAFRSAPVSGKQQGNHSFLGPHSSKSFVGTNESWILWYGTGYVSGILARDDVSIMALKLEVHEFGVAQNESADFSAYERVLHLFTLSPSFHVSETAAQTVSDGHPEDLH